MLVVGLLDRFESAHSRPHEYADAIRVSFGHDQSRVAHGLHASHNPVLHEGIHAPRILRCDVGCEIEFADFTAEMRREGSCVESGDRSDAAAACDDRRPCGLHVISDGGHDSKTRNNDASFTQRRLLVGMLEAADKRCAIRTSRLCRCVSPNGF
jgi:hypothetical protein